SAASAISAAATQTPSAGSAFAQVASSQSESDARATLARLQKQFPGELGGGAIHRADLGSKGIYYRVQVGPVSREAADKICTQLKASGAQCIRTGG
ncbi:MAG: SPOR domain-containing protein, partial [Hyphomicrobiales bacterium]|nr:SPOR domain-containing protein [Hyphomicrobiales bacterium]